MQTMGTGANESDDDPVGKIDVIPAQKEVMISGN